MAKEPKWMAQEEAQLLEMIDERMSYEAVAKALGRSVGAVKGRCTRLKLNLSKTGYSLNKVAQLMGADSHTPIWWVGEGWLAVHVTKGLLDRCGKPMRLVEHEDLIAFLEDDTHWHIWHPKRITDKGLREWAEELRTGVRFYTTREAGEILFLTHYAVNQLIREGRIKAVKYQYNWLIRNDWLHYELQPWRKGAPLSQHELDFIRRWHGKQDACWIARKLGKGRAESTVITAAKRMGLKSVGRGYWKKVRAKKAG